MDGVVEEPGCFFICGLGVIFKNPVASLPCAATQDIQYLLCVVGSSAHPSCNHYRAAMLQQAIEMVVLQMLTVGGHRFPSPVTQSAETGGLGRGIQQILGL